MANSLSSRRAMLILSVLTLALAVVRGEAAGADGDHFERHIRPVLVDRCFKCHSSEANKGGLKADSRTALLHGGESGPAIVPGKPQQSRLLQALRYQDGLEMPPDGRLSEAQIAAFEKWIADGAVWPGDDGMPDPANEPSNESGAQIGEAATPLAPDAEPLRSSLQLWLKADALSMDDGASVAVWPDSGPRGHDVSATKGIRSGGTGLPGTFVRQSQLMGRPAVRFSTETGLSSSPQHRPDIHGDAAMSIVLVMNLQPHEAGPPFDGVIGIGDPAFPGNPGRPLAALIQINRGEDHALHFAGGWNHDASLGPGSFRPWYNRSLILTAIKTPGPMRSTTRLFLNGKAALPEGATELLGVETRPDIQYRSDIGVYLGRALGWSGSIQGDVGEVLVYNRALSELERSGLEAGLAEKYGLLLNAESALAAAPKFSQQETNYWAFQPVQNFEPPNINDPWIRTDIDRFVLAKLNEHQLRPAPPADKRTLLRRVTFRLTGLPPSPDEMDAFLNDATPEAYQRAIDRLLSSHDYGEHWARHWLDVARYAESTANDANAVMRYAWRYRNYVIDAFNTNMPYDQFVKEQLAGDLMPGQNAAEKTRRTIATGFLMVGPKALAETDKEQSRLDIVDDQIDVLGRAILGMTLACARCHDHKFDAIRTTDYYALAGIFRSTEPFMDEARNATMWWEYDVPQADGAAPVTVMAPKDSVPRNLRVHLRGNRFTLGKVVPRGAMSVLQHVEPSMRCSVDPNQITSGRLELADWIVSARNPLTARVIVNRVWQQHFGRGLVATSDNFGTRGELPTHPELLDWLAFHFVRNGWNLQWLHRQILLSNTWQQSHPPDGNEARWLSGFSRRRLTAEELRDAMLSVSGQLDRLPGSNESGEFLYSRAEDISSKIRPNRVGADDSFYTDFRKRSIYLPIVRNMVPDVLTLFDAADPNSVTSTRNATTVSLQSLFLMNHPFVRQQSLSFADRLLTLAVSDEQRIQEAHRLAVGRSATTAELDDARQFLGEYQAEAVKGGLTQAEAHRNAWQSFCQTLLCSNEFIYLD
ncbi:MAG: PSD1 and planctomycete cytochrome C domain-containing protein [Planctomycetaceae bacterium]